MRQAWMDLQPHHRARGAGIGGNGEGIVQQYLDRTDLYQQRWQAGKVGKGRRSQRMGGIAIPEIVSGTGLQPLSGQRGVLGLLAHQRSGGAGRVRPRRDQQAGSRKLVTIGSQFEQAGENQPATRGIAGEDDVACGHSAVPQGAIGRHGIVDSSREGVFRREAVIHHHGAHARSPCEFACKAAITAGAADDIAAAMQVEHCLAVMGPGCTDLQCGHAAQLDFGDGKVFGHRHGGEQRFVIGAKRDRVLRQVRSAFAKAGDQFLQCGVGHVVLLRRPAAAGRACAAHRARFR